MKNKLLYILLTYTLLNKTLCYSQKVVYSEKDSLYYDSLGNKFSGMKSFPHIPIDINGIEQDSIDIVYENGHQVIIKSYYPSGEIKDILFDYLSEGSIGFFKSGKLSSIKYSNSIKNEEKIITWFESGFIKSIEDFINEKSQGLYESYYENGQIETRYNIIHDTIVGDWYRWYQNGQISYEHINFRVPHKKEEIREYYENGIMMSQVIFDDTGREISKKLYYNSEGYLTKVDVYKNGVYSESKIIKYPK